MSPATLSLSATPSLIRLKPFFPRALEPPTVHQNDPEGYLTMADLMMGLFNYTLVILAAFLLGFTVTYGIPSLLAKIQRRRLLKLGGTPGEVEVSMSPSKYMAKVKEWGREIKVRKQERKEQRKRERDLERGKVAGALGQDFSGAGRQGRKLESVLEDVEMQWIEIGLGDGEKYGAGDVKKG